MRKTSSFNTNLFAVQQTVLKFTGNEPTNMITGIMAKGRFAKMLKYLVFFVCVCATVVAIGMAFKCPKTEFLFYFEKIRDILFGLLGPELSLLHRASRHLAEITALHIFAADALHLRSCDKSRWKRM